MTIAQRNILTLSALALLESLHVLALVVVAFHFFPLKYDSAVWNRYFPFLQSAIRPEREMFFYHAWVAAAVCLQGGILWWFREKVDDPSLFSRLKAWIVSESIFLFAIVFCAFKILLYGHGSWWVLLYMVLGCSWAVRIFWPEVGKAVSRFNDAGPAPLAKEAVAGPAVFSQPLAGQTVGGSLNLLWLSAIVVVESAQILIAAAYLLSFSPVHPSLGTEVLPEWASLLNPEREIFLYRFFILTALCLGAAALLWLKYRAKVDINDLGLGKGLRQFLLVEAGVLAGLLYLSFKVIVYHPPFLKQALLPGALLLALAIKLFWPNARKGGQILYEFAHDPANALACRTLMDLAMPVFIFLVIFVPNIEGALARMFIGEQFHHFNGVVMAPTWAYSVGARLNIDVATQYGVGMPVVLSFLTKQMGGVTYEHVFMALVAGCILYYWLAYMFLRLWIKSVLFAAIGIIIGLKWQMFHPGMYPFIFGLPGGLVARYFFDIIFFLLLWRHTQRGGEGILALASICAGVAVFYVSDTGTYLAVAFGAYIVYLIIQAWVETRQRLVSTWWIPLRHLILVPMTTLGLMWATQGDSVFRPEFWYNMREFVQFFLDGYEALPITQSLRERNFLQSLVGFLIPTVYMFTLMAVTVLVFLKKIKAENIIASVWSVYGLGLYHYYVCRSASTQYYVAALPYVFVLCFWASQAIGRLAPRPRKNILIGGLAFAIFALLSNHQFLVFPNLLNRWRNPLTDPRARPSLEGGKNYFHHLFTRIPEAMKLPVNNLGTAEEDLSTEDDFKSDDELVAYYQREFDFSEDAALIARLVPADGKAALMSSVPIKTLMLAGRRPYFYYYLLLVETPMRFRAFASTHLHTFARLQRTINQLERDPPEYIFMEKIFLIKEVPKDHFFWYFDTIALVNYVRAHYTAAQEGKYLVAMRRLK